MYQPTEIDILWAEGVLKYIADGGKLVFPHSGLIYHVNHTDKKLTLLNPETLAFRDNKELHERTIAVFGLMKYSVD